MYEMMINSCGENGKPDFEKMKKFMEDCGCGCIPPMTGSQNTKSSSKDKKEYTKEKE